LTDAVNWGKRAESGFLAAGIDPGDVRGHKNRYIDLVQKLALEKAMDLTGNEVVLDFGCGTGRISHWIAPRVKKVVGLEITPEMLDLAEKNRRSGNVEFVLYDGVHFPDLPYRFDLVLSIGVLQIMRGEEMLRTVSALSNYANPGGRLALIEQASDDPGVNRPAIKDYVRAIEMAGLVCSAYCHVRSGRWWLLYLIRYGLIPGPWLPAIARRELTRRKGETGPISYYKDVLFSATRPRLDAP
jgi:SAM-dependent methyltransferase